MAAEDRWQFSGPLTIARLQPESQEQRPGLEIDKQGTNEVALLLNSSGPGWGSGLQMRNTTPQTGKQYGIYSSANGALKFADVDRSRDVLRIDSDGRVSIFPPVDQTGGLTVLTVAAEGNGAIKVRHLEGKSFQNDNNDVLYLNYISGEPVQIGEPSRRSSLVVTGDLTVGAGGNSSLKARHIEGKNFQNDDADALYLNYLSGKDVQIGETSRPSNLTITGDLSIGPNKKISSSGNLHIAGEERLYVLNRDGVFISKEWGGNGNLQVEGDLVVKTNLTVEGILMTLKMVNDNEAKAMLASLPNGSVIMAVEPRLQGIALVWYWKDGDGKNRKAFDKGIEI